MVNADYHLALEEVFVGVDVHGVEAGAGGDAHIAEDAHDFEFVVLHRPRLNESVYLFAHFHVLLRVGEARIVEQVGPAERVCKRAPHGAARGEGDHIDIVVVAAGGAAECANAGPVAEAVAGALLGNGALLGAGHGGAPEVYHRVLHGDFDLLALAGRLALPQSSEYAY